MARAQQAGEGSYSDAPHLHPNLFVAGIHLLFWLLFHPSAWRNQVARIDPALGPNFSLAELSRAQWRSPILRRILLIDYAVWPALLCLPVWALLILFHRSFEVTSFSVVFCGLLTLSLSLLLGLMVGIAFGVVFGGIIGCLLSLAAGLGLGAPWGSDVISFSLTPEAIPVIMFLAGLIASFANNLATGKTSYSLVRQLGAVLVAVLTGGLPLAAVSALLFGLLLLSNSLSGSIDTPGMGIRVVLALGAGLGVVIGLVVGVVKGWQRGLLAGLLAGVAVCVTIGLAIFIIFFQMPGFGTGSASSSPPTEPALLAAAVTGGTLAGALISLLFALPYVLARRISGAWAGVVAGTVELSVGSIVLSLAYDKKLDLLSGQLITLSGLAFLFGLAAAWWRMPLVYPAQLIWNQLLYRLDERRTAGRPAFLRRHSAFWDEFMRLPLIGLDDHVVMVAGQNPAEGRAAIEYLAGSRQRWAARAAQIELDARRLEQCIDAPTIGQVHRSLAAGELEGPASALLRSFSRLSQDVDAALAQSSVYNQRLALSSVEEHLDGLLRELTRSNERYAFRFRPVAVAWRRRVAGWREQLSEEAESRQEIDNPYIIGVPLTEKQEIFVGRMDVSARIEGLLTGRDHPPILLYGQRRMGKTSLLNNLGRLLPGTIVPLFIPLQGPASLTNDYAGFLYNIARAMIEGARRQRTITLAPLPRAALHDDPFTRFDEWLDEVEASLGQSTALLMLDEFEALDAALAKGRLDEEQILGMLRHLIQHRPRFKVLLAGSHTLEEFERWSSYLINVEVIKLSYLRTEEALQLIERPINDFALHYTPEAARRVLALTRGHPFLVQLLCSEIVTAKNEQDPAGRRLAQIDDVEAVVPDALSHGSFFFADLQRNQVDQDGLALLYFLAAQGETAVTAQAQLAAEFGRDQRQFDLDGTLQRLVQRDLIEKQDGGYRFQVELIRRWFIQYGK